MKAEAYYYLEMLRSNCIELDTLASEVGIESERMALLAERISENSRRGLEACQFMQALLA